MGTQQITKKINVIRSAIRRLDIECNWNVCAIKSAEVSDYDCIHLNESEVRRIQKALSKFLEQRDNLKKEF